MSGQQALSRAQMMRQTRIARGARGGFDRSPMSVDGDADDVERDSEAAAKPSTRLGKVGGSRLQAVIDMHRAYRQTATRLFRERMQ